MSSFSGSSGDSIELNVMPMMDVFSLLITFLLMSFSADPVSHDINAAIELPESQTVISLDEIPAIVVTKNEILVNDKKVSAIFGGDVAEKDRSQGAIYPLYLELLKLAEANAQMALRSREKKEKMGTITLEMDKDHRFRLMKRIMLTGQQADFISFKLMVQKEAS